MVLAKSRDVRILNVEYPLLIDLFRNGRTVLDWPEIEKKLLFFRPTFSSVFAMVCERLVETFRGFF